MTDSKTTIIRTPHSSERPYFVMSRETAQDRNLTFEARGMLAYLLSKPDDWQVQIKDLQQHIGRDKVKAILKELEAAGYLTVERDRHNERGRFARNIYRVHETPLTENPSTVNPSTVEPLTEKPSLTY